MTDSERRVPRLDQDVIYPRPCDSEPAPEGEDNPGELVASARAVIRRLCVEPHRPVTAGERNTLLAVVRYAGALERKLEEIRDATRRAIATLRIGS